MRYNIKHIIAPRGTGKTKHSVEAIKPYNIYESLYIASTPTMYRLLLTDLGLSLNRVMTVNDLINGKAVNKRKQMKYVVVDEFLSITPQQNINPNLLYDNLLSLLNPEGSELVLYSTPIEKFDKLSFAFLKMHGCNDAAIKNIFKNFLTEEEKDKMFKEMIKMKLLFLDPSEVNIILTDFGNRLNDYEKGRKLLELGKERFELDIEAKFLK